MVAGSIVTASQAATATELLPVEAFGSLPQMVTAKLSPDGKYYAAIQSSAGRSTVAIYDLSTPPGTAPISVATADWIAEDILWAKNDRLVVVARKVAVNPESKQTVRWQRAIAVDHTGQNPVVLMNNLRSLANNTSSADIVDVAPDDPKFVYAGFFISHGSNGFTLDLMRVDVTTGDAEPYMTGNRYTRLWLTDGHGGVVARVDQTKNPLQDHVKIYQNGTWRDGQTVDASGTNGAGIVGLTNDGKAIVAFQNGDAAWTLTRQDLATNATSTLYSIAGYDLYSAFRNDWTGRIEGASYFDDRWQHIYFDPAQESLQQGLERAFPGMSVLMVSTDLAGDKVIVEVENGRTPPSFYYLDRTTHQAALIGLTFPTLKPENLSDVRAYPYAARDGLAISAYLTLPAGREAKDLPLIVMPHDGPDTRDSIQFNWMSQFLASRGYAVLQPNYRGSFGYGRKFTDAGLRQWGLKIQDDISDGVRKVIADGIADPKRVCIFGKGYGGYIALAGASFTPDLFACAISLGGISDFHNFLFWEQKLRVKNLDTMSYLDSRIGTIVEDDERLRATSPKLHADQIKAPILLVHAERDFFIPINQSEDMQLALLKAGKKVEFVRFASDDNTMSLPESRIRLLNELERFLSENIGK